MMDAELAAKAAQLGTAGAMRMLAASMRAQARFLTMQAVTMEETAARIERGEGPAEEMAEAADPFERPQPLREREEPSDEGVEAIRIYGDGFAPSVLDVGRLGESGGLSSAMRGWLDEFDDRLSRDPAFVGAVNQAAREGRVLSAETARYVAALVNEERELRAARGEGL